MNPMRLTASDQLNVMSNLHESDLQADDSGRQGCDSMCLDKDGQSFVNLTVHM
jgi:hypothetical protein